MPSPSSQSGGIFTYILIGIVLFAALGYAISRNHVKTDFVSEEKSGLLAAELIAQGNAVSDAVAKLRLRGVTRKQLSFVNSVSPSGDSVYNNPNCTTPNCKVFDAGGGGVSFPIPPLGASNTDTYVWGIGGGIDFDLIGTTDSEGNNNDIMIFLADVNQKVCRKINRSLHGIDMNTDLTGWNGTCCGNPYTGALYAGPGYLHSSGYAPAPPSRAFCAPFSNGVNSGFNMFGLPDNAPGKKYFYFVIISPSGS